MASARRPRTKTEADRTIRVDPALALTIAERRIADLEHDLRVVADALLEEAINRDWCDDYDSFVETVNDDTRTSPLKIRLREVEMVFRIKAKFEGSYNRDSIVINMRDALRECARETFDAEDIEVTGE